MLKLMDKFSSLHNYKRARGLTPAECLAPSAYILECQLRRILREEVPEDRYRELVRLTGLPLYKITDAIQNQVLGLNLKQLQTAHRIYDREGITDLLRFINAPQSKRWRAYREADQDLEKVPRGYRPIPQLFKRNPKLHGLGWDEEVLREFYTTGLIRGIEMDQLYLHEPGLRDVLDLHQRTKEDQL